MVEKVVRASKILRKRLNKVKSLNKTFSKKRIKNYQRHKVDAELEIRI